MPIIKSARKRVKVAKKASIRNSKTKRSLKTALKLFYTKSNTASLRQAQSAVDKAAKKGVIHKNKAARLKSRTAKRAKSQNVKLTSAKTAVKSTAKPKPATTKKTTAAKAAKKPVKKA